MLKRREISKDSEGDLVGLPLELLVIALVMVISIPIIFSFSDMYVKNQVESNLERELDKFLEDIEEIDKGEDGNQRICTIDVQDHSMARVLYVKVGGRELTERTTLRYKIEGEREVRVGFDGVLVSGMDDDGFKTVDIPLDGDSVLLKKSSCSGEEFVEISAID